MQKSNDKNTPEVNPGQADDPSSTPNNISSSEPDPAIRPKEVGGRKGLEPTRYGDWEKDGRCIDF